jgi:hypothetical protein
MAMGEVFAVEIRYARYAFYAGEGEAILAGDATAQKALSGSAQLSVAG